MQFFGALIFFMTLSAACGLRCFVCNGKTCKDEFTCPLSNSRCAYAEANGVVSKTCAPSDACIGPIKCCDKDLCNTGQATEGGAKPVSTPKPTGSSNIPTVSSVLFLLLSSSMITVFL